MERVENKIRRLYLKRLQTIVEESHSVGADVEAAHVEADEILCDILDMLGFKDIVEAYNAIEKWYA